jgi:hypothetical protein
LFIFKVFLKHSIIFISIDLWLWLGDGVAVFVLKDINSSFQLRNSLQNVRHQIHVLLDSFLVEGLFGHVDGLLPHHLVIIFQFFKDIFDFAINLGHSSKSSMFFISIFAFAFQSFDKFFNLRNVLSVLFEQFTIVLASGVAALHLFFELV